MIQKNPRHAELSREVRRQRLHAKRLRGVVPAVEDVQAQLFGHRERPMRALTGDESVQARVRRLAKLVAGATRHDANPPAERRAAGGDPHRPAQHPLQLPGQVRAGNTGLRLETDGPALALKARPARLEAERRAELDVVAQPWVRIQRQVRAVNREIVVQQSPQQFTVSTRPRMPRGPEQAVVNEQKVRPGCHREPHRGQARVHRRSEARNRAVVLDLQAVVRPVVIREPRCAEQVVAMTGDARE